MACRREDVWQEWTRSAQAAMDGKAKPLGSLALLEEWAVRMCGLQETLEPRVDRSTLLIFAADHGVAASTPAVSAYPKQVTPAIFSAIAAGKAASSVLCAANGCDLMLVDVGVDHDVSNTVATSPGIRVLHHKVACGSGDMLQGPAMTEEQCEAALKIGSEAVLAAVQSTAAAGLVLLVGEVGIGNTTSAAALVAALSGLAPEEVVGRGTGLDDKGLAGKVQVVTQALQLHRAAIAAGGARVALQAVGGLEIAAMVGAYLEAARQSLPVIVDGFISGAAAMVACQLDPFVKRCLFLSHTSAEKGAQVVLTALHLPPQTSPADAASAGGVTEGHVAAVAAGSAAGDDQGVQDKGVGTGAGARPAAVPVRTEAAAEGRVVPCAALSMGMRLGEGSAAVLCLPLLRSAAAVMVGLASLADIVG